jgi:hypothetical protein
VTRPPPYSWCTLHVDAPSEADVVTALTPLLGPPGPLDVFRGDGVTAEVRRNPDRTRGPHHLDWPVVVEIDAEPDGRIVDVTTRLVERLHDAGFRVGAECDFAAELPPPDTR